MSSLHRRSATLLVIVTIALLPAIRMLRVRAMDAYLSAQTYESAYYLPDPEWLRVLSVGYREALADLIWTRALVYFGEELIRKGKTEFVFHYGEAIAGLDPDFRAIYRWVSSATLYNTRGATLEEGWKVVDFLERGVRRFPDDGELAWQLGAVLAYELPPMISDPDEKKRALERATEHLIVGVRTGHAPSWVALGNAASLATLGRLDQAVRHLEQVYAITSDPDQRRRLARGIAALRSQAHAEAMTRFYEELERSRSEMYPWVPFDLFALIGTRPVVDERRHLESSFLFLDADESIVRDAASSRPLGGSGSAKENASERRDVDASGLE